MIPQHYKMENGIMYTKINSKRNPGFQTILNKTIKLATIFCASIIFLGCQTTIDTAQSQNSAVTEEDNMINKPVYDYVEGWYDKDPDRMKQGLHPKLAKRHPDSSRPDGLESIDFDMLMGAIPLYGGQKGEKRRIDIEIFDSVKNIAAVKVTSNEYIDYLHLVKIDNKWVIINALWEFLDVNQHTTAGSGKLSETIQAALEKPMRNYVEGWYKKDADLVGQGLHPDLAKRSINMENPSVIDEYTRESLLEVVPLYGGVEGDKRILDIEILDIQPNIAFAKVTSNSFIDYIHLSFINDQWIIVNVLWTFK